jgi:hypothetical protein
MTRAGVSDVLDRFLGLPTNFQQVGYSGEPRQKFRLDPKARVYFKLAASGGEAWERLAEPEWERFVSATATFPAYGESGPAEGELISADRDVLLAWMGWYPEVRREKILIETVKWQTQTDFEALYWKRLPFVYRATFEVEIAKERWNSHKIPHWFWDWWTRSLHWYKQPWELPDWSTG